MAEFAEYMEALAIALGQELPECEGGRTAFLIDDLPYEFRWDEAGTQLFVFCVLGAVPESEEARARLCEALLHAQYCFCESGGFSFGLSHDNTYLMLQQLFAPSLGGEAVFVRRMDTFVKTANVWRRRLAELLEESKNEDEEAGEGPAPESPSMFTMRV